MGSCIRLDLIEAVAGDARIDHILQLMHCKIEMRGDLPGNIQAVQDLDRRLKLPQNVKIGVLSERKMFDVHVGVVPYALESRLL